MMAPRSDAAEVDARGEVDGTRIDPQVDDRAPHEIRQAREPRDADGESTILVKVPVSPNRPVRPGRLDVVSTWTTRLPALGDDLIELRLPDLSDATVLRYYTTVAGGLSGSWVPLRHDDSLQMCAALVGDWLAGWRK